MIVNAEYSYTEFIARINHTKNMCSKQSIIGYAVNYSYQGSHLTAMFLRSAAQMTLGQPFLSGVLHP